MKLYVVVALALYGFLINVILVVPLILLIWRFIIRPALHPHPIRKYYKKGCYAIVTGASEGVGRAYAKYLAKEGFNLIVIARRKELLDSLKEELENEYHINVIIINKDMRSEETYTEVENTIQDKNVTVLVNNAGISIHYSFDKFSVTDIDKMVSLNIEGTNKMTHIFLKHITNQFVH